jgi:hypothetical protein
MLTFALPQRLAAGDGGGTRGPLPYHLPPGTAALQVAAAPNSRLRVSYQWLP